MHKEKLEHAFYSDFLKAFFVNPKLFLSSVPTKEKDKFLECCELLMDEWVQWVAHIRRSDNFDYTDNLFKHGK